MKIKGRIPGERISIRSYADSDREFVSGIWFDRVNGKYLSDPEWSCVDEVYQRALDALADSPYGYYFVVEDVSGVPMGTCSAFPSEDGSEFDLAYCVHRDYWNQGFGTQIVKALVNWCWAQGAERVTAEVAVSNGASNALLRKLGFQILRESEFPKYNMGITYPSYIYALEQGDV